MSKTILVGFSRKVNKKNKNRTEMFAQHIRKKINETKSRIANIYRVGRNDQDETYGVVDIILKLCKNRKQTSTTSVVHVLRSVCGRSWKRQHTA